MFDSDAIRRKSLPAWIREGLEKVEREKRKKQEREEQEALKAKLEAERAKLQESEPEPSLSSKWTNSVQADDPTDDHVDEDREQTPVEPISLEDRIRSFLIDLNKEENFDQLVNFSFLCMAF